MNTVTLGWMRDDCPMCRQQPLKQEFRAPSTLWGGVLAALFSVCTVPSVSLHIGAPLSLTRLLPCSQVRYSIRPFLKDHLSAFYHPCFSNGLLVRPVEAISVCLVLSRLSNFAA